jgi:hypothetical protein
MNARSSPLRPFGFAAGLSEVNRFLVLVGVDVNTPNARLTSLGSFMTNTFILTRPLALSPSRQFVRTSAENIVFAKERSHSDVTVLVVNNLYSTGISQTCLSTGFPVEIPKYGEPASPHLYPILPACIIIIIIIIIIIVIIIVVVIVIIIIIIIVVVVVIVVVVSIGIIIVIIIVIVMWRNRSLGLQRGVILSESCLSTGSPVEVPKKASLCPLT